MSSTKELRYMTLAELLAKDFSADKSRNGTIDRARVAAGGVTATEPALFKVLDYVRAHRNRKPVDPRTLNAQSKSLTEIAYDLAMTKEAVKGALWYWGFMEARDEALAADAPSLASIANGACSAATQPRLGRRPQKTGRAIPKFDPYGFDT